MSAGPLKPEAPLIAFFPEASFGAALNCVGIAQALERHGARAVFICHPGFAGIFADYGFPEYTLPETAASEENWQSFVRRHLPHFDLSPLDQIETYVAPTWDAIVDTVAAVDASLRVLLARLKPDAVVLDNVAMFPAVAAASCPWIRVVSCAETEIPDPAVPPYLSGLAAEDTSGREAFLTRYLAAVGPAHERLNALLAASGSRPLPSGLFLQDSPWLNLVLAPAIVRRKRQQLLEAPRFVYLEGCVRSETAYDIPVFPKGGGPLVYVSFGSLGAADVALIERMVEVFVGFPARFLVNVGAFREAYRAVPDNVHLEAWYPQPSIVAQADLFIHHGGNNSFCEALFFGVPSLVMPYCWDGHDNARRAQETGVGLALNRSAWTSADLHGAMATLLADGAMRARLSGNARLMKEELGTEAAAKAILEVASQAGHSHRTTARRSSRTPLRAS